jgi:hypothetical protein
MGGYGPNGEITTAVSHRSWAADIQIDRATERTQGTATRGRSSPHGAETATQSGIGAEIADCQCTWRHLIRTPAKLTGARHEHMYMGGAHQTWWGGLSRKRHIQYVEYNRTRHLRKQGRDRKEASNGGHVVCYGAEKCQWPAETPHTSRASRVLCAVSGR